MRLHYIALAMATTLLACCDAAFASKDGGQPKFAAMVADETSAMTYGENADKRILRTEDAVDTEEAEEREGGFLEKAKFYYWRKMGYTPAEMYLKFFKGVDRAIVLKNPNYAVWERYKTYYEEESKSS